MDLPHRKPTRLPEFDYSSAGAYFITICIQDRKNILAHIVGGGVLDAPTAVLSAVGKIVEHHLQNATEIPGVHVDKYVIMPNHIHIVLLVDAQENNPSTMPSNHKVPRFVSGLKRLCHKTAGMKFFQRSYHDHVIRNVQDYLRIWEYVDNNPARWAEDCYYSE